MDSSQQIQGRLHNCLKGTRVATLLYVFFLFAVFGFPLVSRLVFILHIYISSSRTCEKNCHILIGCLFVNLEGWPNARNISSQHLATLLHDVATCVERGGQTHATFSSFSTQHVNVYVPQAPGGQEVDLTRMP